VLGGMGNIVGVILGAALLTITPEIFRDLAVPLQNTLLGRTVIDPENLRMLLFGITLVVTMLFKPQGLWPARFGSR
jgi:branched-chain amino acid transport system permease protein